MISVCVFECIWIWINRDPPKVMLLHFENPNTERISLVISMQEKYIDFGIANLLYERIFD